MVEEAQGASPKNDPAHIDTAEDAETRAARRELKQSTISDPPTSRNESAADSTDGKNTRPDTPTDQASDAQNEDMKEQVSSPKKKRAHDQLDTSQDVEENDANSVASTDSAKDRASRLEPEKKRVRDGDNDEARNSPTAADQATEDNKASTTSAPQTSASAFAASGFGKLTAGSSPFANLGGSQGSLFGSAAPKSSVSPFGSVLAAPASTTQTTTSTTAPKLTFGGSSGASPFGGAVSSNGFGSAFSGSSFGSALSGGKGLSSFATPGLNPLKSEKPAKPFGAPDSDEEEDDSDEEGDDDAESQEAEQAQTPEKDSEEKKRARLHRVEVDDGETGEATILSVRAKMFHHVKEEGWKERGSGMLKINAPQACIDFDEAGTPIPGSFDASGLEADEIDEAGKGHKVVRLLMRQDQTHRVILNTILVPAMTFHEKASLKSVGIVFTAFEGPEAKPVSVTMKMTAANAKSFMNEIGIIQRELQSS